MIDVGAQELEGEQHVYASPPLCTNALPHRTIGFEPLEDKLNASRAKHLDGTITLLPNFVVDSGQHVFHINNFDTTSSLLPFNTALTENLRDLSHLTTVRTETVNTSTLDAALADQTPFVGFLKLVI